MLMKNYFLNLISDNNYDPYLFRDVSTDSENGQEMTGQGKKGLRIELIMLKYFRTTNTKICPYVGHR